MPFERPKTSSKTIGLKPVIVATVLVFAALFTAFGTYFLYKYWYPPVLAFPDAELAKKVRIETSSGDIEIELNHKNRFAVAQFTRLATSGFYDQTKFHRVVKNLMIEGGDPLTKYEDMKAFWGQGGLSAAFENETSLSDSMVEGTVAMTGSASGTYGSQFFIVTKDTSWLNGQHTIIGKVIGGMEVVKSIESASVDTANSPLDQIIVKRMVRYE